MKQCFFLTMMFLFVISYIQGQDWIVDLQEPGASYLIKVSMSSVIDGESEGCSLAYRSKIKIAKESEYLWKVSFFDNKYLLFNDYSSFSSFSDIDLSYVMKMIVQDYYIDFEKELITICDDSAKYVKLLESLLEKKLINTSQMKYYLEKESILAIKTFQTFQLQNIFNETIFKVLKKKNIPYFDIIEDKYKEEDLCVYPIDLIVKESFKYSEYNDSWELNVTKSLDHDYYSMLKMRIAQKLFIKEKDLNDVIMQEIFNYNIIGKVLKLKYISYNKYIWVTNIFNNWIYVNNYGLFFKKE